MKILHIIYSLSSGGAERFLVDLANELSQREDCDVRLLILKTDQDERNWELGKCPYPYSLSYIIL